MVAAVGHPTKDAAWSTAAAAVLRRAGRLPAGADTMLAVLSELTTRTDEDIAVPPLGHAGVALPPVVTGRAADQPWDLRSWLAQPDPERAAAAIVADLESGADSLWWEVDHPLPARALAALDPVRHVVVLDAADPLTAARDFARAIGGTAPAAGSSIGADPVSAPLRGGPPAPRSAPADLPELHAMATDLGIGAVVVDGLAAEIAGAGETAEIGYALSVALGYLRQLDDPRFVETVQFRFAITAAQYPTLAKLRAARLLWSRLLRLCDLPDIAMHQHAVTTPLMATAASPWSNLLRASVSVAAAAMAGADAITALPFDVAIGQPDAPARRLAVTLQRVLLHEGRLAAAVDPADGAAALDELTASFADAGWAEFQRIEAAGGAASGVADGSLRARWSATARHREHAYATRERLLTGVTAFPDATAEQLTREPPAGRFADVRRWEQAAGA